MKKHIEIKFENFNTTKSIFEEWREALVNKSTLELLNNKIENGEFDDFMEKLLLEYSHAERSKLGVVGTIFMSLLENNQRDTYELLIEKGFVAENPEYLVKYLKLNNPRKTMKVGPKGGEYYNPSAVAADNIIETKFENFKP